MHGDAGRHLDHFVDQVRGHPSEKSVPPGNPDASHHIKPFFSLLNQFDDFFGRILKIRVQGNDDVPLCLSKSGHNGGMLAVIPVQKNPDNDAGVLVCRRCNHIPGPIGTAVIHQDDFKLPVHAVTGFKTTKDEIA